MEVSFTARTLYPPGKSPSVSDDEETTWVWTANVGTLKRYLSYMPGIEPRFLGRSITHRLSSPGSFPVTKYSELKVYHIRNRWYNNRSGSTVHKSCRYSTFTVASNITCHWILPEPSKPSYNLAQKILQRILSLSFSIFVRFRKCFSFSRSPSTHLFLFDVTLNTCRMLFTKTFENYQCLTQFHQCRYILHPPHKIPCEEIV
jgi:hypothetical protein